MSNNQTDLFNTPAPDEGLVEGLLATRLDLCTGCRAVAVKTPRGWTSYVGGAQDTDAEVVKNGRRSHFLESRMDFPELDRTLGSCY